MKIKPGDSVKIKINGREFETIIDENGTQRFPNNNLVRHLVDSKQIDLNNLCIDYQKGKFTLEEYQEFYRGLGYYVCGFDEIFGWSGSCNIEEAKRVEIENPLWD